MPNPSGLNAHTDVADLAAHLRAAADLARPADAAAPRTGPDLACRRPAAAPPTRTRGNAHEGPAGAVRRVHARARAPSPPSTRACTSTSTTRRAELGGFVRLGNRPNEGRGEMTVCLYLPDGRVGFMFKRPEIHTTTRFDAGGLRFEVVEPFEQLDGVVRGQGRAARRAAGDGRPAPGLHREPVRRRAEVRLTYAGVSDAVRRRARGVPRAAGRGVRQGPLRAAGARPRARSPWATDTWGVDGFGLRDHSWGPRTWQAPWYYRWLTANFGDGLRLHGAQPHRPPRRPTAPGAGSCGTASRHPPVSTTSRSPPSGRARTRYHRTHPGLVHHGPGDGPRRRRRRSGSVTGEVLNLIPLRNRRDGLVTRISEG